MGAGLTSSFMQRKNQHDKREQESLRKQLSEARLVKRDMETLLATAMQTGDEVVDDLRREVEGARKLLERLEGLSATAEGQTKSDDLSFQKNRPDLLNSRDHEATIETESHRHHDTTVQDFETIKPIRPVYIQEYLQHQNARANTSNNTLARGETLLKSLGEGDPRQWSKERRYELIPQLRRIGLNDGEIAQVLHLGKGEVQLVTELRRRA
ncbi:hypothetical protein GTO89_10405 [Heliobacterium gestii]|uniref:Uncharacterized protein n=1 Tax=Heliomicrobium gestii TaxID=2699 RepID=A0A845LEW0_HELGE|nr:hypothetical protein [Heliomicrobium gestii]MBM7867136.1 hypothetical protein [Heliomicrobium gestii]MZP43450.1 hypothetical protein [Heliomicrobium gestii]